MYINYNANPECARVGDCTIRAISKATGKSWEDTYLDICLFGLKLHDMPSANHVWGEYLSSLGYHRKVIDNRLTVKQFCITHTHGIYILAISGHVVCAENGDYYDTWDSGNEYPIYYWEKE